MERDTRALTGLRGIAALWVMLYHLSLGHDGTLAHFASKGYLAVDLFFALSGFVLALNHGAAFAHGTPWDRCRAFYRRRIARVYPLLVAAILLTLAGRAAIGQPLPSALDLLTNFTMTQAWVGQDSIVGPGWSVSVEAFAYLAFPWIVLFAFRKSPDRLAGIILIAWACLWWMTTRDPERSFGGVPHGPLDIHDGAAFPILRCLCGFVAGICAFRLTWRPGVRSILSKKGLPEVLLAAIVVMAWCTEFDVAVAALFVPLICALTVPEHAASKLLRSRLAMHLGDLSYALYLTHLLVCSIVRDALVGTIPYPVVALLCAAASLAIAALLHSLIERPCVALASGRQRAPCPSDRSRSPAFFRPSKTVSRAPLRARPSVRDSSSSS